MPTTRKQKKARKSRGLEMLSDIEDIDIMLGENRFNAREREGSLNSNLPRRSRSFASNDSENENFASLLPQPIKLAVLNF